MLEDFGLGLYGEISSSAKSALALWCYLAHRSAACVALQKSVKLRINSGVSCVSNFSIPLDRLSLASRVCHVCVLSK